MSIDSTVMVSEVYSSFDPEEGFKTQHERQIADLLKKENIM